MLVRVSFVKLFEGNLLNDEDINNLTDQRYSSDNLGCWLPVLTNDETKIFDENGRYIRKSDSNYLNPATSVEEEIGILDEKLHDKDVELTNVKESVGLNVADGKIPDDAWVGTNVIGENPGSVISAIKIIDKKIGKPTDTRDDFPAGATDEEISLYAFINESDFGEF